MTTSRASRIFLFLPLALAAAAFAGPRPAQEEVTAEEYAVYRAVLEDSLVSAFTRRVVVIDRAEIEQPTEVTDAAGDARRSGVPGPVVEDFIERNRRPALLRAGGFGAGRPVRVMSRAAADSVIPRGPEARKGGGRFEWGIVRVSRVGFSADGTMAVLTVSHTCGPRCGTGHVVRLERREGRWRVAGSRFRWIT